MKEDSEPLSGLFQQSPTLRGLKGDIDSTASILRNWTRIKSESEEKSKKTNERTSDTLNTTVVEEET